MHREELEPCEKVLGMDHSVTLVSVSNVAVALSGQGKYAEAEKMHEETLAIRERELGNEYPNTLMSTTG